MWNVKNTMEDLPNSEAEFRRLVLGGFEIDSKQLRLEDLIIGFYRETEDMNFRQYRTCWNNLKHQLMSEGYSIGEINNCKRMINHLGKR